MGLWAGALLDSAQINQQGHLLSKGPLQGKRPGSVIVLLVFIHPHFSYPLGVPRGDGRGCQGEAERTHGVQLKYTPVSKLAESPSSEPPWSRDTIPSRVLSPARSHSTSKGSFSPKHRILIVMTNSSPKGMH